MTKTRVSWTKKLFLNPTKVQAIKNLLTHIIFVVKKISDDLF
jgi:hypothetical protein